MTIYTRPSLAVLLSIASIIPASARTGTAPQTLAQSSSTYRFMVGDVRVTAISDGSVGIDVHALLRGTTAVKTDALLRRGFLTNPVETSINVYLIEIGGRQVLVDAGAGDLLGPGTGGKLVANLAALGVTPDEIDDVLITHVHSDHSGGLSRAGRKQFPKALIHVGKPDLDFFSDPSNGSRRGYTARFFEDAAESLRPYADGRNVRGFEGLVTIMPGIDAEVRPGHTPGSAFYTLESRGERLVFIGDMIHVGEVQLAKPSVTITFDVDQPAARDVRRGALAVFAAERTMIAAPHLPFPGVGHVRAAAVGYEFIASAFSDREAVKVR